jgi:septum formation protein
MQAKRKRQKWILASASPRRREILSRLGLKFEVEPSRIPEPARKPGEHPSDYAVRVAQAKAMAVAQKHTSGLVLGADTIVVLGESILGKPNNRREAKSMLKRLSGHWHEVISGICLIDCSRPVRRHSCYGSSRVHFRRLADSEIEWYLRTGEFRDKAGAYGVQGYASLFIDQIEGCYFNIVGFPIAAFQQLCRRAGIPLIENLVSK